MEQELLAHADALEQQDAGDVQGPGHRRAENRLNEEGPMIGVTQFTDDRWRKALVGLKTVQVKRLKELEKDRAVAAPLVRCRRRR